jgi:hypothetical protein
MRPPRADRQLQELKADDFIDESGTTGASKQREKRRHNAAARLRVGCGADTVSNWFIVRRIYRAAAALRQAGEGNPQSRAR